MPESVRRIAGRIREGLRLKARQDGPSWRVWVAAFGKHPGWDDHMEDIGLDTEVLIDAKRILYEGIRENLEEGSWNKLGDDQVVREHTHEFVWCRGGDVLAGRLWSSRDGKGRSDYPMILCAHCSGLPVDFAVRESLARLKDTAILCSGTTSADQVRQAVQAARAELERFIMGSPPGGNLPVDYRWALGQLIKRYTPEPGREGLVRILYQMDREGVGLCQVPGRAVLVEQRTHARVPVGAGPGRETALLWVKFILGRLGRGTAVLILMPVGESWMDIVAGKPTSAELYCIRASLKAIPLTSSVPYNIEPGFRERINSLLCGAPQV